MGALSFSTEASVIVNGAEQDIEMSAAKRACFEAPMLRADWCNIGAFDHLHSDVPLPLSNHQADRAGLPGDH
jgi:hypothetical protein